MCLVWVCVCECTWYHNTFLVHWSLSNKVVLYCVVFYILMHISATKLYILFFAITCSQDTFSSEDVTWNYCGGKMQIKGFVLRFSLTVHFHTPKSHWSWRSQHLQRWFAAHPCVWSGCSNGQTWIPGQAEKIQLKEICYFFFMSYTDGGQTNKR